MSSDQREQFELSMMQFMRTELETDITFAHLAQNKSTVEAQHRNRQNARNAYDTANHFLPSQAPSFGDNSPSS